MAKFSPGDTIGGQYEVLSLLGEGGMSTVYRCDDLVLKRIVAVKVLHIDVADAPQALRRLQTEGQTIARFQHKNIIQPYGAAVTLDGVPYLVTEVVNGQSLSTLLKGGQLKWPRTLNLISQICDALAHAHSHGVVHRDLKPSNIMVENVGKPNESIKLLDFGIAKLTSDTTGSATQAGAVFGTPAYMSPEQSEGLSGDARSDQYALSCLLYEMLCGEPPFQGGAALQMLMQHRHAEVPSISQKSADTLPSYVESVYQRMMRKDPNDRFPDIGEAKNALIGIKKRKIEGAAVVIAGVAATIVIGGIWFALQKQPVAKPAEEPHTKQISFLEPMGNAVNTNDYEIKEYYKQHPGATKLDLNRQVYTAMGVDEISHFTQLKDLNLWHTGGIDNGALRKFRALPLEALDVSYTDINDDGMTYIGDMKSLGRLRMSSVNVHDSGLKHIEGLHSLESLNINHLSITNRSIPILNKLSLKELHIDFVHIFKDHMRELDLPQLERLAVRGVLFTDESVQVLAKFRNLTDLTLTEMPVSKEGLFSLVKHLKHLKRLEVSQETIQEKDSPALSRLLPGGCIVEIKKQHRGSFGADKDGLLKSFTKFGMDD